MPNATHQAVAGEARPRSSDVMAVWHGNDRLSVTDFRKAIVDRVGCSSHSAGDRIDALAYPTHPSGCYFYDGLTDSYIARHLAWARP